MAVCIRKENEMSDLFAEKGIISELFDLVHYGDISNLLNSTVNLKWLLSSDLLGVRFINIKIITPFTQIHKT